MIQISNYEYKRYCKILTDVKKRQKVLWRINK